MIDFLFAKATWSMAIAGLTIGLVVRSTIKSKKPAVRVLGIVGSAFFTLYMMYINFSQVTTEQFTAVVSACALIIFAFFGDGIIKFLLWWGARKSRAMQEFQNMQQQYHEQQMQTVQLLVDGLNKQNIGMLPVHQTTDDDVEEVIAEPIDTE